MSYETEKWKVSRGAIDDREGLWIRVDTTNRLHPVMEAFVPREAIEEILAEDSSV